MAATPASSGASISRAARSGRCSFVQAWNTSNGLGVGFAHALRLGHLAVELPAGRAGQVKVVADVDEGGDLYFSQSLTVGAGGGDQFGQVGDAEAAVLGVIQGFAGNFQEPGVVALAVDFFVVRHGPKIPSPEDSLLTSQGRRPWLNQ